MNLFFEIGNIFFGYSLGFIRSIDAHNEAHMSVSRASERLLYCICIWALANTGSDTKPTTLLPPCACEHEPKAIFVHLYCCVQQTRSLYSHDQVKDINYSCIAETLSFSKCLSMWTNKQLTIKKICQAAYKFHLFSEYFDKTKLTKRLKNDSQWNFSFLFYHPNMMWE